LNFLGERVEAIQPWGIQEEAPDAILEVTFLPKEQREQKLLAFPKRGAVNVYLDGSKIGVFTSGDASKYFRQNGAILENASLAFDNWFGV
jgi:hypothetical protein